MRDIYEYILSSDHANSHQSKLVAEVNYFNKTNGAEKARKGKKINRILLYTPKFLFDIRATILKNLKRKLSPTIELSKI